MDKIFALICLILLLGVIYLFSMWIRSTIEDIGDKFAGDFYDYYCEGIFLTCFARDDYKLIVISNLYYVMFSSNKKSKSGERNTYYGMGLILTKEETLFAAQHPELDFHYFLEENIRNNKGNFLYLNDATFDELKKIDYEVSSAKKQGKSSVNGQPLITTEDRIQIIKASKYDEDNKRKKRIRGNIIIFSIIVGLCIIIPLIVLA